MNIVKSFSATTKDLPVLEEFEKIADREGKDQSKIIVELIQDYVKNHSNGNPSFILDDFNDPGFRAIPTLLSPPEKWKSYISDCNADEINKILAAANEVRSAVRNFNFKESIKKKKERFGI